MNSGAWADKISIRIASERSKDIRQGKGANRCDGKMASDGVRDEMEKQGRVRKLKAQSNRMCEKIGNRFNLPIY